MSITIEPYARQRSPAVAAFNERMRQGGSRGGFYVDAEPGWLKSRPGARVWREYYVAVDDQGAVHGAYALKPQQWLIHGRTHWTADWQGPFSEGAVDSRHGTLALRLLRDMQHKQPLLYSYGHGGNEQAVVQLLRRIGWLAHPVPFCLLVLHPTRFLLRNGYLRRSRGSRLLLDLLAYSGLGAVGLRALHLALRLRSGRRSHAVAITEPRFGEWADELWSRCASHYQCLAVRDQEVMNTLVPEGGWPLATRLRIERDGATIGWAVVIDAQLHDDPRFGDLRVGLVVDSFGLPADAADVVHAAVQHLARAGVDMVYANQSHPAWIDAFVRAAFVILRNRRLFVAAPALQDLLAPWSWTQQGLHLTNLDGHGPFGFP
jgi:hypothetical protein